MDWVMKKGPSVPSASPSMATTPTTGASRNGCDEGSCLLGNDGKCVENATSLLSALKKQLELWHESFEKGFVVPSVSSGLAGNRSSSRLKITSPDHKTEGESDTATSKTESKTKKLQVRGVHTGIARKLSKTATDPSAAQHADQFDWSTADQAIARSLSLIMRLEKDRKETVGLLEEEKSKVKDMRAKLDAKAAERLKILANIVQKEHEQCLQDMLEMKWHAGFEGRHLKQIQDDVKLIIDKNVKLKQSVDLLNKQSSLLQEKIQEQAANMAVIVHKQTETNQELGNRQEDYAKMKRKLHQAKENAEAEIKQMERVIKELQRKVDVVQKDLKESIATKESIIEGIEQAKTAKMAYKQEKEIKDSELHELETKHKKITHEVKVLSEHVQDLDREIDILNVNLIGLGVEQKEHEMTLSKKDGVLQAQVQSRTKEMRECRESNENMHHEIEEMKEQTTLSYKKNADAQKTIKTAEKELRKVDKQLTVIHEQTEAARIKHRELVLELREKEDLYDHEEYNLKSIIQSLKEELHKETKSRRIFQSKVAANTEDLEKMKAEHRRQFEKVTQESAEADAKRSEGTEVVEELMKKLKQIKEVEDDLTAKLKALNEEIATLEKEMGDRINILTPQNTELEVTAKEKKSRLKDVKEKIAYFNEKLKDTHTSQMTVDRMRGEIEKGIETFSLQKAELEERLAEEEEIEKSWQLEFEEISNFSQTSDEKYETYTQEREELFSYLDSETSSALLTNRELASAYEEWRDKHAKTKRGALRSMERKLVLETAMKDKVQLHALQSKLNQTLQAHYQHRGNTGRQAIKSVKMTRSNTISIISGIDAELDQLLKEMKSFLDRFDEEQIALIQKGQEPESAQDSDGIFSKMTKSTKNKDKSVSFAIPLECS